VGGLWPDAGSAQPFAVWIVVLVPLAAWLAIVFGGRAATRRSDRSRAADLQAWAAARGWKFEAVGEFEAFRWDGPPFRVKGLGIATNVVTGTVAGREVVVFDYRYDVVPTHEHRNLRWQVAAMELPVPLPLLELVPENGIGLEDQRFSDGDDIQFESEDFNRAWHVAGHDQRVAYDIVHPRLMELLLRPDARLPMRIEGKHLLCWVQNLPPPQWIDGRLALMRDVVGLIPDFVWQRAGHDPNPVPERMPAKTSAKRAGRKAGTKAGRKPGNRSGRSRRRADGRRH
jgi:hypothetical protein